MKHKRTIILGIFLVAVVGIGVVMFATHGFLKSGSSESAGSTDAVESYTYTEHHSDGSEMNLVFEELYGKWAAVMKFKDGGGAAYYHTTVLSDDNAEKFLNRLNDYQLADNSISDESAWTKGVLVIGNKKQSTSYNISPVDITGLKLIDPWSDKIETIVNKPSGLDYMSVVGMEDVSGAKNNTELYAFMSMVNDELTDLLDGKQISKLTVDDSSKTLNVYKISVYTVGEKEPSYFVITPNGYVANMTDDK